VKQLKVEGWRNDYHYDWIVSKYQDRYFNDIVLLSQTLSYEEFEFFYEYLRPMDRDLPAQIQKYSDVITQLEKLGEMEEHSRNLRKIIDDLTLRIQNTSFNADINLSLSRLRAVDRYSYIQPSSVSYNFHLAFAKEEPSYEGMAEISFTLTKVPPVLPLDCLCNSIYKLNANQTAFPPLVNGEFLFIPQSGLRVGTNLITIHYRNTFNNDGLGCMSYLEKLQTPYSQYIYTKFEPYGAHRFVPCFDQPDFRASAQFNLIVPSGWKTAGNELKREEGEFTVEDYKLKIPTKDASMLDEYLAAKKGYYYGFEPTKNISTYLYCIAAG
jgi:hypothetical protein